MIEYRNVNPLTQLYYILEGNINIDLNYNNAVPIVVDVESDLKNYNFFLVKTTDKHVTINYFKKVYTNICKKYEDLIKIKDITIDDLTKELNIMNIDTD